MVIIFIYSTFVKFKSLFDNVNLQDYLTMSLWSGNMVAKRIKALREKRMTQSELARQLGITRASVNAWKMNISAPSTQHIVSLVDIFSVSTDQIFWS